MENQEEHKVRTQRIRDGGLLDAIRTRTAMYTGERTLSAVSHFLSGYQFAQYVFQIPSSQQSRLPFDFHDWVAYRLHFLESTSGYRRMILKHAPDESAALDRFFELLDEHRNRQARVVAAVRCHPSSPDVFKLEGASLETRRRARVAEELRLVVYTNDPGFFLVHDDQIAEHPRRSCFCPSLTWIKYPFKPEGDYLTILDQEQYERLLQEDEAFRRGHRGFDGQRNRQARDV
jgi:hypothetical protein